MASTDIVVLVHVRWPWLVAILWHLGLQRAAMLLVRVDQRHSVQ